jgi:2-dehydro-3-deoxyphosphogluconate aldolase/(4S)-4-hydroxy-2-oxoglutarate aldolase
LSEQITDKLSNHRIIPIAKIEDPAKAILIADILEQHHLPLIEILFQTETAADCIRQTRSQHPKMLIGAGTIITPELAAEAIDAGADFLVAPGFNPRVVDFCLDHNMPFIPGVDSCSLIEAALDKGLRLVKFYPAQASGGIGYLKAIAGPYKDIRVMPTGGINPGNLMDYLSYDKVVICGASWITPTDAITAGDYGLIKNRIRLMLQAGI